MAKAKSNRRQAIRAVVRALAKDKIINQYGIDYNVIAALVEMIQPSPGGLTQTKGEVSSWMNYHDKQYYTRVSRGRYK